MSNQQHRTQQKHLRHKRDEYTFLFDSTMTKYLAKIERDEREWAIEMAGGNVSEAAKVAGINDIPRNARALWGKSERMLSPL